MSPPVDPRQGQYELEADALIRARIARLRGLSIAQAKELSEAAGEDALVAGQTCKLTTFMQRLRPDQVLITVQVARFSFMGLASHHTERGLVFSHDGSIRDATPEELATSGG